MGFESVQPPQEAPATVMEDFGANEFNDGVPLDEKSLKVLDEMLEELYADEYIRVWVETGDEAKAEIAAKEGMTKMLMSRMTPDRLREIEESARKRRQETLAEIGKFRMESMPDDSIRN